MATGAGKEKRRRLHSTDRRESPNKANILRTAVSPGGTFAGTEVLGSTQGKASVDLAHVRARYGN